MRLLLESFHAARASKCTPLSRSVNGAPDPSQPDRPGSHLVPRHASMPFTFIPHPGFSPTRAACPIVALLGPCYKTGDIQPFRQPLSPWRSSARLCRTLRGHGHPVRTCSGTVAPGLPPGFAPPRLELLHAKRPPQPPHSQTRPYGPTAWRAICAAPQPVLLHTPPATLSAALRAISVPRGPPKRRAHLPPRTASLLAQVQAHVGQGHRSVLCPSAWPAHACSSAPHSPGTRTRTLVLHGPGPTRPPSLIAHSPNL